MSAAAAAEFLRAVIRKVDAGIEKAYNPETKVYDTISSMRRWNTRR